MRFQNNNKKKSISHRYARISISPISNKNQKHDVAPTHMFVVVKSTPNVAIHVLFVVLVCIIRPHHT